MASHYLFDTGLFIEVCVVEDFWELVVVVVHHELDAVDQRIDLVKLVQLHVHFAVYIVLKFVRATCKRMGRFCKRNNYLFKEKRPVLKIISSYLGAPPAKGRVV